MRPSRIAPQIALSCLIVPLALGCASDEKLITTKVQFELDACKRAEGATHEVKFETGPPYVIDKSLCETPVTNVRITDKINGHAEVGPYDFELRQNVDDGRWLLTRVTWPELDQARNIDTLSSPSEDDLRKADELLAKAEQDAPKIAEVKTLRLKSLLIRRKQANKSKETDRSGLGVAEDYFAKASAAAKEQGNADLELSLRLQVINYLDRYRTLADESSTVSEQSGEWDEAAVKAIRQEARDAKKAGNNELAKQKEAEAVQREKDNVKAAEQRVKDAETMKSVAAQLLARECKELAPAKALTGANADLRAELDALVTGASCPAK